MKTLFPVFLLLFAYAKSTAQVSFTTKQNGEYIEIHWVSADTLLSAQLERSTNKFFWEHLQSYQTDSLSNQYLDQPPVSRRYYYRLKWTTVGGRKGSLISKAVNYQAAAFSPMQIGEQPGTLTIKIEAGPSVFADVFFYHLNGKLTYYRRLGHTYADQPTTFTLRYPEEMQGAYRFMLRLNDDKHWGNINLPPADDWHSW